MRDTRKFTTLILALVSAPSGVTGFTCLRPRSFLSPSPTSLGDATTMMEEPSTNPRLEGLALRLDVGTRKSHSLAENTAFVSGFFRGLSTRDSYSDLLTSLYFVYVSMEDAFDSTREEMVKKMDCRELRRVEPLARDMEFFFGADWKTMIAPSPATKRYVQRVEHVAKNRPRLLLAHQYTRYLGDLFGGQMMGGMATRSLDLGRDGRGVQFYTFDRIDDTTDFITEWYAKLNELDISDEEKEEIVEEANLVFALNIEIFEELEGSPLKAVWTLAWKSFRQKIGLE